MASNATTAQHGDPVGDFNDFTKLVANEHDGFSSIGHCVNVFEQLLYFCGNKNCSGFIEKKNFGALIERFYDFNALTLTNGKITNDC